MRAELIERLRGARVNGHGRICICLRIDVNVVVVLPTPPFKLMTDKMYGMLLSPFPRTDMHHAKTMCRFPDRR